MTPEFDHYSISRVLGEGGTGVVYLARDRRTGLDVAVKVVAQRELDAALRARLPRESAALVALSHPNVVRFHEFTESRDGALAIVTEYVDGSDFRSFEGLPFPELLPLMVQAVRGLAYLKSRNVVHGDLSSDNFLVALDKGTRVTKIVDLGFAAILRPEGADGASGTGSGQFVGKFAFASPEHFFPSDIDWRSDVYSLGVVFHRLLTNEAPITVSRESRYFDWMVAHEKEHAFEVPSPPGGPALPEALRDMVRRMLARSRDDRPQSYEEILAALDRVRRVAPAEPEPAEPVESSQQKRWPDLEVPESHTERFVSFSATPSHAIPVDPAPHSEERRFEERRFEEPPRFEEPAPRSEPPPRFETASDPAPSSTELLSPPSMAEAARTAPTVVTGKPERDSDDALWTGGAANDASPEPLRASPGPAEEKTERLDDVIEKLRQRSSLELLPPLTTVPPSPEPATPAPPSRAVPTPRPAPLSTAAPTPPPPPIRRSEPAAAPARPEPSPRAASKPGQRVVVYGAPPAAVPAPRRAPAPPPPAPTARATDSGDRRLGRIGIGLIVAAIVVLFAAVLWVLVAVVRGASAGAPRRSSAAGRAASVAAASAPIRHSEFV